MVIAHKVENEDKKHVLFVAGVYLPVVGGYIKVINELCKHFVKQGYSVDILTCNTCDAAQIEVLDGMKIYRLASWNIIGGCFPIPQSTYSNFKLISNLRRYNYVVTNTRFYPICLIGWIISLWHESPLLHLEHGSKHTVTESRIASLFGRFYDHVFGSLIVKSAKMNFGVSRSSAGFLKHIGAKKVKVMHNGIDYGPFQKITHNGDAKQKTKVTITYIGRLVFAKGVQDLISVVPSLVGDFQLLIVGDGPYKHELEKLVCCKRLQNIHFAGEQQPDQIPGILRRTDIFINPSYSEGLPTTVLEACAAGCAVIATNVGGTNEIIQDGLTGILVEPGNLKDLATNINILISDKTRREDLGSNAKKYVLRNFSWDQIIKDWLLEIKLINSELSST